MWSTKEQTMQGETIYKGGLNMKIVRMEYQRADYTGGRLSTRGDYTLKTIKIFFPLDCGKEKSEFA